MTREEAYPVAAYRYLLSCTMASYESWCLKKSTPKHELDRLESMIMGAFKTMAPQLAELSACQHYFYQRWDADSRTARVLDYISRDGTEGGVTRYFLETRHGQARQETR